MLNKNKSKVDFDLAVEMADKLIDVCEGDANARAAEVITAISLLCMEISNRTGNDIITLIKDIEDCAEHYLHMIDKFKDKL